MKVRLTKAQKQAQKELIYNAYCIGLTATQRLQEWQKAPCQDAVFLELLCSQEVKDQGFGFSCKITDGYNKGKWDSAKV